MTLTKVKHSSRGNGQKQKPVKPKSANSAPPAHQPAVVAHQPAMMPRSELLQLQRQVGNQAMGQLLAGNQASPQVAQDIQSATNTPGAVQLLPVNQAQPVLGAGMLSRLVQRDETEGGTLTPVGNNYELKVEQKGDRWSISLAFAMARTQPNPLKGEAGPASGQIGDSKISRTRSYKQGAVSSANSMAAALAKGALEITELMPGVTVKVETKALEAKLENGEVDVDVFKLAFVLDGNLTQLIQGSPVGDEILATELGEAILNGMTIKLTGKIEIKIDPSDAARLVRMAQLNKAIADNAKAAAGAKQKIDALEDENRQIRDQLKKRGSKLKKQARQQLKQRLKQNGLKIKDLGKAITDNRKATQALQKSYQGVVKGLKSKAGRLMGEAVKRVGGKILLKLIPGVNIITTALDVLEVSVALYKLFTGKAKLGFGGGSDGGSAEGEGPEAGTAGESTDTGTTVGGDAGTPSAGVGEADGAEEEAFELGPEIDIEEELAYTPATGVAEGEPGKPPEMHPTAMAVLEAIKSKTGQGVKLSRDDLAQLNNIVPDDLTSAELTSLLEWLKESKGKEAQDPFAVLGAVQEQITQMRSPEPIATVTVDGEKEVTAIPVEQQSEEEAVEPQHPDPQAIQDQIAATKPILEQMDLIFYAQLQDKVEVSDIQQGTMLNGWMTVRNQENQFFAGFAAMVVIKLLPGAGRYEIRTQPTMLYDEAGQPYGVIRSVTLPVRVGTNGQSPNGKGK